MAKGTLLGWQGIGPNAGEYVAVEDGFGYVCQQVGIERFDRTALEADEFEEMLIDWYFSGNWIEVRQAATVSVETLAALHQMGAHAHGGYR